MPVVLQNIAWVGKTSQLVTAGPTATPAQDVRVVRHIFDAPRTVSITLHCEKTYVQIGGGGFIVFNDPWMGRYRVTWGVGGGVHTAFLDASDVTLTLTADSVDVSLLTPSVLLVGGGGATRTWRVTASCAPGTLKMGSPTFTMLQHGIGAGNLSNIQTVPPFATHYRIACENPLQEPNVRLLGYAGGLPHVYEPRGSAGVWPQSHESFALQNDDANAVDAHVVWTIGL